MRHLGDITRLNGAEIEPVDVITGGSPCQDLSLAGKQAGLSGDRSGLFHEQMRLVCEMREATGGMYPRFMVWENVPGALSTNKGADFREVLNECVKVVEEAAPDVPMPEKGGWPKAGVLYGEMGRWSIAWRIHDTQFWGVPQRRRRIALVCDFRGMRAPEVLFESQSVSGDFNPCNPQGKGVAEASVGIPEESDRIWDARGNGNGRLSATLTGDHDNRMTDYTNVVVEKNDCSVKHRVRRLTPLECTRLQGYPDGWVDIGDWTDTKGRARKEADAPKYKALGNSIALPFWKWLLARIYKECESHNPALGSLFDGIGGFPLCWPGRTAWSSEIEEFALAVLRARFGEEQDDEIQRL